MPFCKFRGRCLSFLETISVCLLPTETSIDLQVSLASQFHYTLRSSIDTNLEMVYTPHRPLRTFSMYTVLNSSTSRVLQHPACIASEVKVNSQTWGYLSLEAQISRDRSCLNQLQGTCEESKHSSSSITRPDSRLS